jgi:DNA-directed RNA polymerase subunit F
LDSKGEFRPDLMVDSKTIELLNLISLHPRLTYQLKLVLRESKVRTKEELDAILEDFVRPQ